MSVLRTDPAARAPASRGLRLPDKGTFIVVALLLTLGFYLIYPVVLILVLSFNTAPHILIADREWGMDNWRGAFSNSRIYGALWNTIWLWGISLSVSLPFSVVVAWLLARTRMPGSHVLELLYWVSYVSPGGLIGWIMLLDPGRGFLNTLVELLPFVDNGPFNIFSVPGIIFVNVVGGASATSVMILTPIFRNMDAALEEAGRVSGSSSIRTMVRITLPIMISPVVLIFALNLMRMFTSFERELILGYPIGFYVYSTLIWEQIRGQVPPDYGSATALASMTLIVIAVIIPFQRWILSRRRYTTITGAFKPGLIDLGHWKWLGFAFVASDHILTMFTLAVMLVGSFMTRVGFFDLDPMFTLRHWQYLFSDETFRTGIRTTFILSIAAGIGSPLLFSLLAYVIIRTRWRFRFALDTLIWVAGALPGFLSGLGLLILFLATPGLSFLYGTIWALIIVVLISGMTQGVNLVKTNIVQVGYDMEEAARVSGAGWFRTFFLIWLPLMAPLMVLIGLFNFNSAANTTSTVVLLASRDTMTVSLVILDWLLPESRGGREVAAAAQLLLGLFTLTTAIFARHYALKLGIRHRA